MRLAFADQRGKLQSAPRLSNSLPVAPSKTTVPSGKLRLVNSLDEAAVSITLISDFVTLLVVVAGVLGLFSSTNAPAYLNVSLSRFCLAQVFSWNELSLLRTFLVILTGVSGFMELALVNCFDFGALEMAFVLTVSGSLGDWFWRLAGVLAVLVIVNTSLILNEINYKLQLK